MTKNTLDSFEKQSSGGPILPKTSEILRKYKNQSQDDSNAKS